MARYLGFDASNEGKYYFVSYNSDDEKAVAQYAIEMKNSGINIWYDHGIEIGAKWEETIAKNIKSCEAVIMFLSKNLLNKERSYVHKEYEIAKRFAKKDVYIIFLDEIKDSEVPPRYQMWWVDVTGLQSVEAFRYNSEKECIDAFMKKIGAEPGEEKRKPTEDGIRRIAFEDGRMYEGPIVGGKANGKGKITWHDGRVYEGDFVDGHRTGVGRMTWPNGDVYEGDFVAGKRTGMGKLTWHDGKSFEGSFAEGKYEGEGRYTLENGTVYQGTFTGNKLNGAGVCVYADGREYNGEFQNGKMTGKGKFIWPDGSRYEGDFLNGKLEGKGRFTWPDGSFYEGTFRNGKMNEMKK